MNRTNIAIQARYSVLLCGLMLFPGAFLGVQSTLLASPQAGKSAEHEKSKTRLEFIRGNMGEVLTRANIHLGFTDYKSTDGISLTVLYENFGNPDRATEALEKETATAARLIRRGPKLDSKGNVVGQRAEVLLQSGGGLPTLFAVMWTDGVKYHEIHSRSMKHILELEKDYRY